MIAYIFLALFSRVSVCLDLSEAQAIISQDPTANYTFDIPASPLCGSYQPPTALNFTLMDRFGEFNYDLAGDYPAQSEMAAQDSGCLSAQPYLLNFKQVPDFGLGTKQLTVTAKTAIKITKIHVLYRQTERYVRLSTKDPVKAVQVSTKYNSPKLADITDPLGVQLMKLVNANRKKAEAKAKDGDDDDDDDDDDGDDDDTLYLDDDEDALPFVFTIGPTGQQIVHKWGLGNDTRAWVYRQTELDEAVELEAGDEFTINAMILPIGRSRQNFRAALTLLGNEDGQDVALSTVFLGGTSPTTADFSLHSTVAGRLPLTFIDWKRQGSVDVYIDGRGAHTHLVNRDLVKYNWFNGSTIVPQAIKGMFGELEFQRKLPVGKHLVFYLIGDDHGDTQAAPVPLRIVAPDKVPGANVLIYANRTSLKELNKATATFGFVNEDSLIKGTGQYFPQGNFVLRVMFTYNGKGPLPLYVKSGRDNSAPKTMEIRIDGKKVSNNKLWKEKDFKNKLIDVRVAASAADVPLVIGNETGGSFRYLTHDQAITQPVLDSIYYDFGRNKGGQRVTIEGLAFDPAKFWLYMTYNGKETNVTKNVKYDESADGYIVFTTPRSPSTKRAVVQFHIVTEIVVDGKPVQQRSNSVDFTYWSKTDTFSKIKFASKSVRLESLLANHSDPIIQNGTQYKPTRATYCFGRVYVPTHEPCNAPCPVNGSTNIPRIYAYKFNWNYTDLILDDVILLPGLTKEWEPLGMTISSESILGIACDPWGTDDDFDIYFSHTKTFLQLDLDAEGVPITALGGKKLPYMGGVSKINSKDGFSTVQPVIKNLPSSLYDHGVNGVTFLHDGRLLVCVGGMTNAGFPSASLGWMPEVYYSAAILVANVKAADFDGDIQYGFMPGLDETSPWLSSDDPMDIRNGEWVKPVSGDVRVFASGFRNTFDVVQLMDGTIIGTDNGPNGQFGLITPKRSSVDGFLFLADSFGEPIFTPGTKQSMYGGSWYNPNVTDLVGGLETALPDELNVIYEGMWYGHPNVVRARAMPEKEKRQAQWRGSFDTNSDELYQGVLAQLESSTDGICPYRAATFGGASRNNLYIAHYGVYTYRVVLGRSEEGRVIAKTVIPDEDDKDLSTSPGLDAAPGPAGIIMVTDLVSKTINLKLPVDYEASTGAPILYQIDPWRAPKSPGNRTFEITGVNFKSPGPGWNKKNIVVKIGGVKAKVTAVGQYVIRGVLPKQKKARVVGIEVQGPRGKKVKLSRAFRVLEDMNEKGVVSYPKAD